MLGGPDHRVGIPFPAGEIRKADGAGDFRLAVQRVQDPGGLLPGHETLGHEHVFPDGVHISVGDGEVHAVEIPGVVLHILQVFRRQSGDFRLFLCRCRLAHHLLGRTLAVERQEHDRQLAAGNKSLRLQQIRCDPVQDPLAHRPLDGGAGITCHAVPVGKAGKGASVRGIHAHDMGGIAVDGRGHLLPGDGKVRTEGVVLKSVQDVLIGGPHRGLGIPGPGGDICVEFPELRLGIAGHGVQSLYRLSTGHGLIRLEDAAAGPGHVAPVHGGIDIVFIPGVLHIGEDPGPRGELHRHVLFRHGEGVHAGAAHGIEVHLRRSAFHGLHPFFLRQLHRQAHVFSGSGGGWLRGHRDLRIAAVASDAEGSLRQDGDKYRHIGIRHDGLIGLFLLFRHGDAVGGSILHPYESRAVAVFRQHRHFQGPSRRQAGLGQGDGGVLGLLNRDGMLHRIGIDDVLPCQHSHGEDQKDGQGQDHICSCFLHDPHLLTVSPYRVSSFML